MPTIHQNRKLMLPLCIFILIVLITRSPSPLSYMAINFLFSKFYILVYLFIFISALFAASLVFNKLIYSWRVSLTKKKKKLIYRTRGTHNLSSLVDLFFSPGHRLSTNSRVKILRHRSFFFFPLWLNLFVRPKKIQSTIL